MTVHPKETHVTIEVETIRSWIHRLRMIRNTIKLLPGQHPGNATTTEILKDVAWLTLSMDKVLQLDLFDEIRAKNRRARKPKGTL